MESEGMDVARIGAPQPMALTRAEVASQAVATQARAAVEARYLMALQRPRNIPAVRQKLLEACDRPTFAAKARYALPRGGKKIPGFTIRFAEEVARSLTNLLCESMVIFDGDELRIVRCTVTDLEANLSWPIDVPIAKTVERHTLKDGQTALSERRNDAGLRVFTVAVDDNELLMKQNSYVSRALRTGILRICPADLLEEAEERIAKSVQREHTADPKGAVKKICDAFYKHSVTVKMLEEFLGHPVAEIDASEFQTLKEIYAAITEEGVPWRQATSAVAPVTAEVVETKAGVEAIKQNLRSRRAKEAVSGEPVSPVEAETAPTPAQPLPTAPARPVAPPAPPAMPPVPERTVGEDDDRDEDDFDGN